MMVMAVRIFYAPAYPLQLNVLHLLISIVLNETGKEVSNVVSRHLGKILKEQAAFKKGDYSQALNDCYMATDVFLRSRSGMEAIKEYVAADKSKNPEQQKQISEELQAFLRNTVESAKAQSGDDQGWMPTEEELQKVVLGRTANVEDEEGLARVPFYSGCTAVTALIVGNKLYCANSGDSRCMVCRNGIAVEMSFDHKPEDEIEIARIVNAGSYIQGGRVDGNLNLTRALGDFEHKEKPVIPELQPITAQPDVRSLILSGEDEFILMACDGIWGMMESQEAVTFVRSKLKAGMSCREAAEALCDACCSPTEDGEGTDNETVLIVRLKKQLPAIPSAKTDPSAPTVRPLLWKPNSRK